MYDDFALQPCANSLSSTWDEFVTCCTNRPPISTISRTMFVLAWCFIGAVSVYDAWLVKLYQVCILDVELNPIAWYLIKSGGDVMGFVLTKAFSTAIVLVVLAALHAHAPRLAYPVIAAVSGFQLALLLFLSFA